MLPIHGQFSKRPSTDPPPPPFFSALEYSLEYSSKKEEVYSSKLKNVLDAFDDDEDDDENMMPTSATPFESEFHDEVEDTSFVETTSSHTSLAGPESEMADEELARKLAAETGNALSILSRMFPNKGCAP